MPPPSTARELAQAEQLFRSGRAGAAEMLLQALVARDATSAKAFELLAYIRGNRNDLAACEELLAKAAALPGCSPEALFYLGRVQLQRGRPREAVPSFGRAIELAGEFFEGLHELGVAHSALGEQEQALAFFRRAERLQPRSRELQSNLADTLAALHQFDAALQQYDRALSLDPRSVQAWANRGTVLTELGRGQAALESYERALALDPQDVPAWMNKAATLTLLKRHPEALACYDEAARIAPRTDYLPGHRMHAALCAGRWDDWAGQVRDIAARVDAGDKAALPWSLMPLPVSAATLLNCARTFARDRYPARAAAAPVPPPNEPPRRLRVGYFSTDFRNHATSQLMARVLECHDHGRFEWFGFSLWPFEKDELGARAAAAFDHFVPVAGHGDAAVAAMARQAGLDIAVDLNGYTEGMRPGIFAHRAAPVQVSYLGFPGSMGTDYMNYIVADATLIRPEDHAHYAEKAVLMPHSYQANDNTKRIGDAPGTRADAGLPEHGFVFACFNNGYKITPDVFDVWMRLLRAVPGSVLWLLATGEVAQQALQEQARLRGVDPARLVWAPRKPLADHLARHVHADLFLDTFHYNAHTTGSDALWSGLPMLTLEGATFPARVGASLLKAVGLPELVTRGVEAYESLALALARDPQRLAELRARLGRNRTSAPLFDSARFARNLEAAFDAMWRRHAQGLPPDHIHVGEGAEAR